MFRRLSKSASRKGTTAYKFSFTFELANLTGIPANVDHAALTFVRGAKTHVSSVAPVEESAAIWHDARSSRLEFVATLYKDASGTFQTKQYALKAQGVTGAVYGATATVKQQRRKTFAKSVLDLASFASLHGTGLGADAELQYVTLDSCTKGTPDTVAGMIVTCTWLRDATPGEAPTADSNLPGSIRVGGGSEATELVFVGVADPESSPGAAVAREASAVLDEQDLEGFAVEADDAHATDEVSAFPDVTADASDVLGADDRLSPVREGTPGRELAGDPPSPAGGSVAPEDDAASLSPDRHAPARVLVRRAVAPLREEIDRRRASLAEAVTKAALAESEALERAADARAAREELRAAAAAGAVAEERARAFEAESVRLKAALLASEERRAAQDAAFSAAEARAADEASARRAFEEGARAKLSAAAEETAAATRAKDELRSECMTLRHALTQSDLALKKAKDEATERAASEARRAKEAAAAEEKRTSARAPLRDLSERETSAKQMSVMKKLLERLRADLEQSEASVAKVKKALSFEASARKDAEARADEASARAKAAEAKTKTPEPKARSCALIW